MLPLLLMLISDPSAPPPPAATPDREIPLLALDISRLVGARCGAGGFQRVDRPSGEIGRLRTDLTYRPDGEVRRYLLLDRSIEGCPAPISYALPDRQDGFIRELGRTDSTGSRPNR